MDIMSTNYFASRYPHLRKGTRQDKAREVVVVDIVHIVVILVDKVDIVAVVVVVVVVVVLEVVATYDMFSIQSAAPFHQLYHHLHHLRPWHGKGFILHGSPVHCGESIAILAVRKHCHRYLFRTD